MLAARARGDATARVSLDLGLTMAKVGVEADTYVLPGGARLTLSDTQTIATDEMVCYRLANGGVERLQRFDDETGRFYKLVPTEGAPTMEISGVRMHRTKDVTPWRDTEEKIATVRPVIGCVLDTTMGLGYTAILAARTAREVLTIERDPGVEAIARQNPWSAELFSATNIKRRLGDSIEIVATLPAARYDRVVHDPPTLALAGELYGAVFYRELLRVLRPGGRLFHYTGAPGSRGRGRDLARQVIQRLRAVGFTDIRLRPEALGVVATASVRR